MESLSLNGLQTSVSELIKPFLMEVIEGNAAAIHSIHVVGSAVTPDYYDKHSNINTVILLRKIDFAFLKSLGDLGKKHKKRGIAAPFITTPAEMNESLDVFPMEFLELKKIHKTVYGEDILATLQIDPPYLRLQCEREIAARLVGVRQGYISSLGQKDLLNDLLARSITGCFPLFRAMIFLMGIDPPMARADLLRLVIEATVARCKESGVCMPSGIFEKVLAIKHKQLSYPKEELAHIVEDYYRALEIMDHVISGLKVSER